MSTIAGDPESIKYGNAQRRNKISIRCSADLCFRKWILEFRGHLTRLFEQIYHARRSFQRRALCFHRLSYTQL